VFVNNGWPDYYFFFTAFGVAIFNLSV